MIMKAIFTLDFDDLHPESGFGLEGDLQHLFKLKEMFPKLKTTFYLTPDWIFKPQNILRKGLSITGIQKPAKWNDEPFRLDKNLKWCKWITDCVDKKIFEICIHGYYHFGKKHPFQCEFQFLDEIETEERIKMSLDIFDKSGIPYVRGFRAPGWGWNPSLINILKKYNFKFVAHNKKVNGLPNLFFNADAKNTNLQKSMEIIKEDGMLLFHGHTGGYINNITDEGTFKNLVEVLNGLDKNIKYLSHSELAKIIA
jgi:peptidoglycan/xylan/chitin deacetylase (PgdA/CDA1 family)